MKQSQRMKSLGIVPFVATPLKGHFYVFSQQLSPISSPCGTNCLTNRPLRGVATKGTITKSFYLGTKVKITNLVFSFYLDCFRVSLMTETILSSESGEEETELSESRSSVYVTDRRFYTIIQWVTIISLVRKHIYYKHS